MTDMKTIVSYVREFLHEEWHPGYFAMVGGMLAALFSANYYFDLERTITRKLAFPHEHIAFHFVFYFVPYVLAHAARAIARKDWRVLQNGTFWVLGIFMFSVLAVYIALHDGPWFLLKTQPALFAFIRGDLHAIVARCASNILPLALMSIPVVAYWWTTDRHTMPLYGFTAKTIGLRPYFTLLACLLPLVVAASFTPDFQQAYPRYKFGFPNHLGIGEQRALIGVFELCYGADFVFVEFFFRGFMVLGLVRLLGSRAIIPMVVVYALIHFEKPLLEALSSIIGGLALGVISYRTKSIYGGVILHLGIAYMMEIAGTFQMMK